MGEDTAIFDEQKRRIGESLGSIWVVLYFYPKDTIEAHNFQRDLSKYQQKNAIVLGVSADTVDSHQQFCTKESLTFKLLADPNHQATMQYGSSEH